MEKTRERFSSSSSSSSLNDLAQTCMRVYTVQVHQPWNGMFHNSTSKKKKKSSPKSPTIKSVLEREREEKKRPKVLARVLFFLSIPNIFSKYFFFFFLCFVLCLSTEMWLQVRNKNKGPAKRMERCRILVRLNDFFLAPFLLFYWTVVHLLVLHRWK